MPFIPKQLVVAVVALALVASACTSVATPTPTTAPTPTPVDVQPVAGSAGGSDGAAPPAPVGDSPPPPLPGLPNVADVIERVMPAVVQVLVEVERRDRFGRITRGSSQGSGFFFDDLGHILTNNHVVEDAVKVEVALSNRQRLEADVVGRDPETDLAVLRVDPDLVDGLVPLPLGDTDAMRIGDWVIAIGSPLGFAGSVTVGVVSAKGRSLSLDPGVRLHDLVQTDAIINPGNSGGPLLNLQGEVIGINTAIIRGQIGSGQEAEGIGFAISMGTTIPVSRQLVKHGRMVRPRMGVTIEDVNPALAIEHGLAVDEGVRVASLAPGGPADRAGVRVNDVIVRVDDVPVTSTSALVRLFLTLYEVGGRIVVTVDRDGSRLSFEMVLEEVTF